MENEIANNKLVISQIYRENQGTVKVINRHKQVLEEKESVTEYTMQRIRQTNEEYRTLKISVKKEKAKLKALVDAIKIKHTEIMDLEEKQKKISALVKKQKDTGESLPSGPGPEITQKEEQVARV